MQLQLPGRPHLTYCTNIHAGERWDEIATAFQPTPPPSSSVVSPDAPMGVGLRLSASRPTSRRAAGACEITARSSTPRASMSSPSTRFPTAPSTARASRSASIEPDWRDDRRLHFTDRVRRHPGASAARRRPRAASAPCRARTSCAHQRPRGRCRHGARRSSAHAAHLHALARRTGKTIVLALEPEPWCFFEINDSSSSPSSRITCSPMRRWSTFPLASGLDGRGRDGSAPSLGRLLRRVPRHRRNSRTSTTALRNSRRPASASPRCNSARPCGSPP